MAARVGLGPARAAFQLSIMGFVLARRMSNWERLRGDLSVIANSKVSDAAKRTVVTVNNGSTLPIGRRSPIGEAAAPTEANPARPPPVAS